MEAVRTTKKEQDMVRTFCVSAFAAGMLIIAASGARAQQPTEAAAEAPVILSINGGVRDGTTYHLSRAELERLPRSAVRTATPWHDGVQLFEGVSLSDLMAHVGARGSVLKITALNAYLTEIPVTDAARHKPILAYLRNAAPMPVRDKGPLFIVYPYDSDPALRSEVFHSRSAWQVRAITIE